MRATRSAGSGPGTGRDYRSLRTLSVVETRSSECLLHGRDESRRDPPVSVENVGSFPDLSTVLRGVWETLVLCSPLSRSTPLGPLSPEKYKPKRKTYRTRVLTSKDPDTKRGDVKRQYPGFFQDLLGVGWRFGVIRVHLLPS